VISIIGKFTFLNNIVYNNLELTGSSLFNKAYCIYVQESSWLSDCSSDYNNLYAPGLKGKIGFFNGLNLTTLVEWRNATNQYLVSVSRNPHPIDFDTIWTFKPGWNMTWLPFNCSDARLTTLYPYEASPLMLLIMDTLKQTHSNRELDID